jgi:hypothetical protein
MVQKLVMIGYVENYQVSFSWNFWKFGWLLKNKNPKFKKELGRFSQPFQRTKTCGSHEKMKTAQDWFETSCQHINGNTYQEWVYKIN